VFQFWNARFALSLKSKLGAYSGYVRVHTGGKNVKKQICVAIVLLVVASMFCGIVAAQTATSPGPKPGYGDGIPDGNQFIQPDAPGPGPAPNSGDGTSDGSGF